MKLSDYFFQTYQVLIGLNFTILTKGGVHRLETYERRTQIWEKLRIRRKDTIANLANEFNVSKQTIRRDIDVLSREHNIYTLPGRYSGGIFVGENTSYTNIKYFDEIESDVLNKILAFINSESICFLTAEEKQSFKRLIDKYTKPKPSKDVHKK